MTELTAKALDDRQQAFVRAYCETGDAKASALAIGYSETGAAMAASRLTRTPQVLAAIHIEMGRRLLSGAPAAYNVMVSIMKDTAVSAKVRLDAAKALLDRAGHVTPRAKAVDDDSGRSLHELSLDELRDQRERLESEIAGRAKQLNAPIGTEAAAQATDMFE